MRQIRTGIRSPSRLHWGGIDKENVLIVVGFVLSRYLLPIPSKDAFDEKISSL